MKNRGNFFSYIGTLFFSSHRNNLEIMWNILKDKILEGVNKYVPSSLPFWSSKKATWKRPINATTRSLIKQYSKYWKHYVKSKDPKVMASYKKIRNSVRNKKTSR